MESECALDFLAGEREAWCADISCGWYAPRTSFTPSAKPFAFAICRLCARCDSFLQAQVSAGQSGRNAKRTGGGKPGMYCTPAAGRWVTLSSETAG